MKRSRDDTGQENEYGVKNCPRCGRLVTTCAFGFTSHLKKCLQSDVVIAGKLYKGFDLVKEIVKGSHPVMVGKTLYHGVRRRKGLDK